MKAKTSFLLALALGVQAMVPTAFAATEDMEWDLITNIDEVDVSTGSNGGVDLEYTIWNQGGSFELDNTGTAVLYLSNQMVSEDDFTVDNESGFKGEVSLGSGYFQAGKTYVLRLCAEDVATDESSESNNCDSHSFVYQDGSSTGGSINDGTDGTTDHMDDDEEDDSDADEEDEDMEEEDSPACSETSFNDVADDSPYAQEILTLWCDDVIHGMSSRSFDPTAFIRRGEAAKIVARLFGIETMAHADIDLPAEGRFGDTDRNSDLTYYLNLLDDEGYIDDWVEDGNVSPSQTMTVDEIMQLVEGILGSEIARPDSETNIMTRGEFVDFILEVDERY